MSEFMERHTVSKLIGCPPGYVGFDEGAKLTEAVRRTPYSVVLFDEIEKAHPDLYNVMLQIFDDGRLTDSKGRVVTFQNCLVVLTSNVGAHILTNVVYDGVKDWVFLGGTYGSLYQKLRYMVREEMKMVFRPEFLNRLDDIVVFRLLSYLDLQLIAKLMTRSFASRVALKGISLYFTPGFMELLVREGHDPVFGARPLRRALTRLGEDVLAETILKGPVACRWLILHADDEGRVGLYRGGPDLEGIKQ